MARQSVRRGFPPVFFNETGLRQTARHGAAFIDDTAPNSASVVATLGFVSASASASQTNAASATATLGSVSANAPASQSNPASATATLGSISASASASQSNAASATATLGSVSASASASQDNPASATATLGSVSASVSVSQSDPANATATLGPLSSSASASQTNAASATATFGPVSASVSVSQTNAASVTATLGSVSASASASQSNPANATATLGSVSASASITDTIPNAYTALAQIAFATSVGGSNLCLEGAAAFANVQSITSGFGYASQATSGGAVTGGYWQADGSNAAASTVFWAYAFDAPVTIVETTLVSVPGSASLAPTTWSLDSSPDGVNWTNVANFTASSWSEYTTQIFDTIPNSAPTVQARIAHYAKFYGISPRRARTATIAASPIFFAPVSINKAASAYAYYAKFFAKPFPPFLRKRSYYTPQYGAVLLASVTREVANTQNPYAFISAMSREIPYYINPNARIISVAREIVLVDANVYTTVFLVT